MNETGASTKELRDSIPEKKTTILFPFPLDNLA